MKFLRCLTLLCGVALATSVAGAQNVPNLVLIHGFGSSGETWSNPNGDLVTYLQDHLILGQIYTPTYAWELPVETTAPALFLPFAPYTTVLVGHSEGGIVSRYRAAVSDQPFQGLVTMGAPNLGANIATNQGWFLGLIRRIGGEAWDVRGNLWAINSSWVQGAVNGIYYLVSSLAGILQYVPYDLTNAIPVAHELAPHSELLNAMNTTMLPAETANAAVRVSIVYADRDPGWAPAWRLLAGEDVGYDIGIAVQMLSSYSFTIASEASDELHELDMCGPDECGDGGGAGGQTNRVPTPENLVFGNYFDRYWALWDLSWEAYNYGADLWSIDPEWCWDVGSDPQQRNQWAYPECNDNDGFIGTAEQLAPGSIRFPGTPSLHSQETQRGSDLARVLSQYFFVSPRP